MKPDDIKHILKNFSFEVIEKNGNYYAKSLHKALIKNTFKPDIWYMPKGFILPLTFKLNPKSTAEANDKIRLSDGGIYRFIPYAHYIFEHYENIKEFYKSYPSLAREYSDYLCEGVKE